MAELDMESLKAKTAAGIPLEAETSAALLSRLEAQAAEIERLKEELRASRDHAPTTCSGLEWRPIETAPRDGTVVIGASFGRYETIARVWWQPEFEAFISGAREMVVAPGYTFNDGSTRRLHSPEVPEVTHWMPLPLPPVQLSTDEGPGMNTKHSSALSEEKPR